MVHLVEDHERLAVLDAAPVEQRVGRDAGVGHRDAEVVAAGDASRTREVGVEGDADRGRRLGPLGLQVLGRGDDDDALHDPSVEQVGGEPQRVGGLAGTRRGDGEEVPRVVHAVGLERRRLPRAQLRLGAARHPVEAGRGGGRGRHRTATLGQSQLRHAGVPGGACHPLPVLTRSPRRPRLGRTPGAQADTGGRAIRAAATAPPAATSAITSQIVVKVAAVTASASSARP